MAVEVTGDVDIVVDGPVDTGPVDGVVVDFVVEPPSPPKGE